MTTSGETTTCDTAGCTAQIEGIVECWLTLGPDGWRIYGFSESAHLYCGDFEHDCATAERYDSLMAFLAKFGEMA